MSKELEAKIDGLRELMEEKHSNLSKTTDRIDETLKEMVGLPKRVKDVEKDLKCHKKGHWKFIGVVLALLTLLALIIEIIRSVK